MDCKKKVLRLCDFTFAMSVSQFTVLFRAHIFLRETISYSLYISKVQVSNSSFSFFAKGHAFCLLADGLFSLQC